MTDIPAQLKMDTGYFYGEILREGFTSHKIQNLLNLIKSLKTIMKVADNHEHDQFLAYQELGAMRAWSELTRDRNEGRAVQTMNVVLGELQFLIYDDRYVTKPERDTWQGRSK